ncbi:glycosyl transferase family 1 [Endozoicomonas montiporae]|uniref:tRNA-queuosine alpha-mannosyltransferase n=2 Tax=Endozoicomonas montiporae TaxID=1027273 RepID=A0A081N7A0_9GAMM|nr:DUF3524 domain-containing protein [Endozoicomonas montiporae]AMO55849.1 glycosyltransferase [Endozoicomonas montiporae CL-33]KEQ14323.1 glycosyl transferase family 1 [Endozoicomonas montiporae]
MKILLLSAYDAMSHRYWRKGLVEAFPQFNWTVLTLPARYFSWRLRGNSLSWAFGQREVLEQSYDLLICTSMTDLSALKGMVPGLAKVPTLCYYHENQFAYPQSDDQQANVEPLMLNLYTALAADRVLFNTTYNRDTFFKGAERLLKKLPDHVPLSVIDRLRQRSAVLPVPLPDTVFPRCGSHRKAVSKPVRIVWAARWEYDKGGDRLLAVLQELERRQLDFRLCILGQRFRNTPMEFDLIGQVFSHRLDQFGYASSREDYLHWLRQSDIVLSTAIHEFQGVSILEAVTSGCVPVLPDREVYPELFDSQYIYPDCGDDVLAEAVAAADVIERHMQLIGSESAQPPSVDHYRWSNLRHDYLEQMLQVVNSF